MYSISRKFLDPHSLSAVKEGDEYYRGWLFAPCSSIEMMSQGTLTSQGSVRTSGVQLSIGALVSTRGKTASSGIEGMDQRPSFHEKAEHGMLQIFS